MRILSYALGGLLVLLIVVALALRGPRRERPVYWPYADPTRAAVSGRIVDADGDPVAGVDVGWWHAAGEVGSLVLGGKAYTTSGGEVRTGPDGAFHLAGLVPGEGYVALAGAAGLLEGETGRVQLRAGEEASALELRAREIAHERRLEGRVLRADGSPAASVRVQARRNSLRGSWTNMTVTDAAGEFRIVAPWAGGECELVLRRDDGTEVPLGSVAVDAKGVVLRAP